MTFTGVRRDFWRLIIRGALLELITLGFYRFWLATDMRRHFWSHTSVEGDSPEYTGTAMELFIGFLIALAILVPLNLAYFFLTLEAELWKAFASIPFILFIYLFYQFARYRARRYRLTRTVWRGVRFWMKGSGWDYAWRAGLWMLAAIFSFGLAIPWSAASLERFKIRNTFYGDLPARFEGTGSALFANVWWLWLPFLPLMLLAYGLVFVGLWALIDAKAVMNLFTKHFTAPRCRRDLRSRLFQPVTLRSSRFGPFSPLRSSRRMNGAGGCPAFASAMCASSPNWPALRSWISTGS